MPTIDSATNPAAIDEVSGDSSAQNIPATTGTITFTDQDLDDSLPLSVTGNASASYTHPMAAPLVQVPTNSAVNISTLIASGAISFDQSGLTSDGGQQTIDWTYDPDAADLDWLQDGDTLTLTYTAQITDGAGNVGSQNLVININGTNDVPTIDSATNPAAIDEVSGDSSAQNIPATTGTITFTDQDLGDSLTLSVTGNASASYTPNGGSSGAVPTNSAVNISTLIASGAISFDQSGLTSDGGQQTIDWTYDPDAADLDWLQDGDNSHSPTPHKSPTALETSAHKNLVININGTNDVPTIDNATNPAAIDEVSGDSSAQNIPATHWHHHLHGPGSRLTLSALSVTGNASASPTHPMAAPLVRSPQIPPSISPH